MEKLRKFKSTTSSVLSSTFMFISFLCGVRWGVMGAALSFLFGIIPSIGLAEFCSRELVSVKWIRSRLTKPYFIEGYWRIKTARTKYDYDNPDNPSFKLTKNGVMLVQYDHSKDKYSVVVSRLDNYGDLFTTESEYCYMTEEINSLKYLNYFDVWDATTVTICISHGKFLKRYISTHSVDYFSSRLYVEGDAPHRNQHAVPLKEGEYKRFKDRRKDWQGDFLRDWERNPDGHEREDDWPEFHEHA